MVTDDERREIARKLRELADYCDENEMSLTDDDWPGILSDYIWPDDSGYHIYDEDCRRIADLIDPEPDRTWHDFSDELPPVGASVLCRGKNGAPYVGKPVTLNGSVTRKVWVPRGDQYRSPENWMAVDE